MTEPGFYRVNGRDYIVDQTGRWRSTAPGSMGVLLALSLDGQEATRLRLVDEAGVMSGGQREAVEALDEVERRIIHAIETLDPNGSLFHVRAVRAALLANPPQDAGEGLHPCRHCGIELDADDRSARCEECEAVRGMPTCADPDCPIYARHKARRQTFPPHGPHDFRAAAIVADHTP